jgi:streptomycin 6-kinase
MIEIPAAFTQTKSADEGDKGRQWLAVLPRLVDELLGRWTCTLDGEVLYGQVGIVVPVKHSSHGPCVLKVSFPHPGNIHEPDAYAAWSGRGAVMLYERDDESFAMLLERVQTMTLLDIADADEAVSVAGRLSRRLAIPAPAGMPRLAEQAGNWEQDLRRDASELAHPLPPRAVDAAMATAREIGRAQPSLMVHGDFHATNILRAERESWLAVDPKGYAGDPAYDVRMVVAWRPLRVLGPSDLPGALRRGLDIFADAAELEPERVRRWAQFHAVHAALWGRRHGFRTAGEKSRSDFITEFAERIVGPLTELI